MLSYLMLCIVTVSLLISVFVISDCLAKAWTYYKTVVRKHRF